MSEGIDDLIRDLTVDDVTFQLNQLSGLGFCLGVDEDNNRFVVRCNTTGDPTHYITYDEDEDRFDWSKRDR